MPLEECRTYRWMLRIVIKPRHGRMIHRLEGPFLWDECLKRQFQTWTEDFQPDIHVHLVAIPVKRGPL